MKHIDAADERINSLIVRSNSPITIVKSGERRESKSEIMTRVAGLASLIASKTGLSEIECSCNILLDDVVLMGNKISSMTNDIDRLEAALHKILNERDQLLKDLKCASTRTCISCVFCVHCEKASNELPCDECFADIEKPNFEWRGIPESEERYEE